MILCPQLVMACEFSLGLLPYIKILLSSPTFRMPVRMGRVRGLLAGGWIFVAAIFVVPFEAPGKWGMKDASVHSYVAGQGWPRRDKNGGEEDVRDPLCIHVSAARAEVALANPVFYTCTNLQQNKNGEINHLHNFYDPSYCISALLGFAQVLQLMGKKKKVTPSLKIMFIGALSRTVNSGTS